MNNRSLPAHTLLPHLYYRNLPEACEWLTRVFGFAEYYRYGEPVAGIMMCLGDAVFMITSRREHAESPATLGCGTQMLTVFVPDVDAHCERTKQAGAEVWEDLHETVYGEKQYGVRDLDGHRWLFSQHAHDVDPAEWGAVIKARPYPTAAR